MSEHTKVCVYYSEGPHVLRVIEAVRKTYPNAELTAMFPPDYPVSGDIESLAASIVRTERNHYSPRDLRACVRLVRRIRAARFDVCAVLFDSNQLLLLAALSGAPACIHGTMDGRLSPLPHSLMPAIATIMARLFRGHCTYAIAWLAVHLLPVRVPKSRER